MHCSGRAAAWGLGALMAMLCNFDAAEANMSAFNAVEARHTAQLDIIGCEPTRGQSCKMAALVLAPVKDGGECLGEVVATQSYRLPDTKPFRAIETIVELRPLSRDDDRASPGFFKVIMPLPENVAGGPCVPRTLTAGSATYAVRLWSDPVAPVGGNKIPVDTISAYSARLGETTGADARGILDHLFGPSFGGNSVAVTIASAGPPRQISLPDGSLRATVARFRVTENGIGRIRVQLGRTWRSLLECRLDPTSRRWTRLYRC